MSQPRESYTSVAALTMEPQVCDKSMDGSEVSNK